MSSLNRPSNRCAAFDGNMFYGGIIWIFLKTILLVGGYLKVHNLDILFLRYWTSKSENYRKFYRFFFQFFKIFLINLNLGLKNWWLRLKRWDFLSWNGLWRRFSLRLFVTQFCKIWEFCKKGVKFFDFQNKHKHFFV